MSTETKKNPVLSIALGFALLIVHVLGTLVLAFVGDQTISNVANVFGVLLGTLTLAVAIGFGKKSWIWGIVSFVVLFVWNTIMSTIALFVEPWLGNLMFGFAIIILCPFAFGLMLYNWPTKTAATEEIKKVATLEPVPAPVVITDPELVRVFARTNHRLALLLESLNATDLTLDNPDANATDLFVAIEARFASLFEHFNIVDDTNTVLPLHEDHE